MSNHTHHRKLVATVATAIALGAATPSALAMPIDRHGLPSTFPQPDRVKVVRVQVDQGMDWGDAGIGAAGMLALVLVGVGGAYALTSAPSRRHTTAHS